ncbi:MAG: trypsin-like peptidase domain-containing protein [Chthoniobacterales bacterium]
MKSFLQFLLFVLVITLALAGLYAWKSGHFEGAAARPPAPVEHALPDVKPALGRGAVPGLAALDEEFTRVAEAVIPSVVSITSRRGAVVNSRDELLRQFFGLPPSARPEAVPQGSGALVSAEGHIVTNVHVIEGADEIVASLSDGRRLPARLLGADPLTDLAVLKIEAGDLRPLSFADSEKVRVGQLVFAIGNPFGLQETITQGIISARERLFSSEVGNEFFQTDAAINPGNSGGPLVNIRGEIVGLNNFIFSQSGGSQGIGFSIPANTVRRVLDQILEHGRVLRPHLGVMLEPLDAALADRLGLPDDRGALVGEVVAGSPAAEAGLQRGDVIRKFDGREVRDFNDLRKRVATAMVDAEIELEVRRGGDTLQLPVTLREMPMRDRPMSLPAPVPGGVVPQPLPPTPSTPSMPVVPPARGGALAGVSVGQITPALVARQRLPENIEGVLVRAVAPDSPAAGRLRPGDAIEQVNDTPVTSPEEFAAAVAALPSDEPVMLLLSRGRVRSFEVVAP